MVLRHNQLRDIFVDFCHKANLSVKVEAGSTLTPDLSMSRPTDALVSNWSDGIPIHFRKQVSHLELLHYWQSGGSTRLMTPSVTCLGGNALLLR